MNRRVRLTAAASLLGLALVLVFVRVSAPPADAAPRPALPTQLVLPSLTPPLPSPTALPPTIQPSATALLPTTAPASPTTVPASPTPEPLIRVAAPTSAPTLDTRLPVVLPPPRQPVPDQVIITFNPGIAAEEQQAYIQQIGGTISQTIEPLNAVVVTLPDAANALRSAPPGVAQAEPDYYVTAQQSDPLYPDQWGLPVVGAPTAWTSLPANTPSIAVAVIDSGICAAHPDLAGRILPGWDYVQGDIMPQDEYGHGCAVAGVIAANADGAGMVGVAPNTRILPLRVLNAQGSGTYSDVAAAIVYAADRGAAIINLSLGGVNPSDVLEDAVNYAVGRGALVIAAAGNTGGAVLYPAAYAAAIAVASVDRDLQRSSFSSYGPEVDLLAPGRDITVTTVSGGYTLMSGTSFAAPHVSGVAALEMALGGQLNLSGSIVQVSSSAVPVPPNPTPIPTPEVGAQVVTDTWAVILTPGADPNSIAAQLGYENLGPIGLLENTYLFRVPGSSQSAQAAQTTATALQNVPQVQWFEQQIGYQQSERVPSDPLLTGQWHLNNTGQAYDTNGVLAAVPSGEDANLLAAWNAGYDGTGAQIAVVDDGLQRTHPDIAPNYAAVGSYDYNSGDADPMPVSSGDDHGTSAAGVAAARDDGSSCGVGAAYRAKLAGIRLIAGPSTDAMEANALNYASSVNHIYSNSWGPSDDGATLRGPGTLTLNALRSGVINGRGGRGSIYVWAAGNGRDNSDNVNADGYANSRYVIAVGATGADGTEAFYSEPGAPMLVNAPSSGYESIGVTTTDLLGAAGGPGDCTYSFGGTSSATPLVAGVIGLMLDANPNLTWRDVQHILVRTAEQNDPTDPDWTTNAAGFNINHNFGFGRVDAGAAVNLAESWVNVPPETSANSPVIVVNQPIPRVDTGPGLTSTVTLNANMRVEHVEVVVNATHSYRGDLEVRLTAPSGTSSLLMTPRSLDSGDNFSNWKFTTVRNWGETAAGTWTLSVADRVDGDDGTLNSWQIIVYGTQIGANVPETTSPSANAVLTTTLPFYPVTLSWTAPLYAVRYEVRLDTANPPVSAPIPVTGRNYTQQLPPGVYSWQVRAFNSFDEPSPWSPVRSFTLNLSASAAPVRNRTTDSTPDLSWGAIPWAQGYEIQVDTDMLFAAPYAYQNSALPPDQLSVTIPPGNALADGVYYWRVRAKNGATTWGSWSAVETLVVDAP